MMMMVGSVKENETNAMQAFGFNCDCPLCSLPIKEAEVDDLKRQEVRFQCFR